MQSKAATVPEYMAQLPSERRAQLQIVRDVILKNLDKRFEEGMQYGMIGYYVPHSVYPAGYHCDPRQPLPFGGLASQKNHLSLYLMCMYGENESERWFRAAWEKTGKKLDMGKCCIRFKKSEDLALDLIGEAVARMPVDRYIEIYESARQADASRSPRALKTSAKPVARKAPKTTATAATKKSAGKKAKAKKTAIPKKTKSKASNRKRPKS